MANLISPGVSVTITDESFFIPAAATTIPLLFIATAAEKTQPDGVTAAPGTYEHNVIRTVTSLTQSTQLYGIPRFLTDTAGLPLNGDARNEYGLFALNQFLGIGNLSYVIRANVNLDDDINDLRSIWNNDFQQAAFILENNATAFINEYNTANNLIPSDPGFKVTVTAAELLQLAQSATAFIWQFSSFDNSEVSFFADHTVLPLPVYCTGYSNPPCPPAFLGFVGQEAFWVANMQGSVVPTEWTPSEASNFLLGESDQFQFTQDFLNQTSLGANDAARRAKIVQALQAAINSNTDIRNTDQYQYNLVLCPGYWETVDELLALVADIQEEAFVIADTPSTMDPDQVVVWAGTPARQHSRDVAYYYPWCRASNLDGAEVFIAPSGTALRTYTYSDEVAELWFAPAGLRRGLITGIDELCYVTGTLGTPTLLVEVRLNLGQRDNLYKYFTNLNPLVFFTNSGFVVWGQKTSAPDASALDRVAVMRMVMYIKKQLRVNTQSFVFEPNDQLTRDSLKAVVDGFLGDLVVKRGLYDFATVCDQSNNTPDRIDRNEMYIDVALKPVKAAEFIYIPIRIVATGAVI